MASRKLTWALTAGLSLALISVAANAGILASSTNAMGAWQGSRNFVNSAGPMVLDVNLDFAVFAPGTLGLFLSEYSITPTAETNAVPGSSYVYAYQIITNPSDTEDILQLTVGSSAFSGVLAGTVDGLAPATLVLPGTVDAALKAFQGDDIGQPGLQPTSALWDFVSGSTALLNAGESSAILFFSSTDGPVWDSAMVNAGLLVGQSNFGNLTGTGVPRPSPEPASLFLIGMGAALLGGRVRRHTP
ncbi:MAG: PEP-CTERM sorting domain-containing protein [Phycisphaeraceae bacterium]|nr:PEP-CTERM sorting domain-containing protein [Phycisphaeraceae bacterium]